MALMLAGPNGRKPQMEFTWVVVAGSWHRMLLTWAWTEISGIEWPKSDQRVTDVLP